MYLGLWAAFGEEHDLEYARRCAKVLMDTAVFEDGAEGGQASWKFALDRVALERLSTPIGFSTVQQVSVRFSSDGAGRARRFPYGKSGG